MGNIYLYLRDIGDKIHPIKAHAPKLTEVTPHNAVSYSYRVKPPQVLSMSTKATPIKPSTFRIRLGFWEKINKSKCLNVILTWNWGKDLQSKAAESTQPLLDLINLFIGSNSGSEVIAVASQRMFRTFCYGVCMSQVFSGSCSFTHYQIFLFYFIFYFSPSWQSLKAQQFLVKLN